MKSSKLLTLTAALIFATTTAWSQNWLGNGNKCNLRFAVFGANTSSFYPSRLGITQTSLVLLSLFRQLTPFSSVTTRHNSNEFGSALAVPSVVPRLR